MTLSQLPAAAGRTLLMMCQAPSAVALAHLWRAYRTLPHVLLLAVLAAALALALTGGLLVYALEAGRPGARIHSVGDGLWWAIGTLATVGYGDTVPVTVPGRLIGIGLMLAGVGTLALEIAMLTALFVADRRVAHQTAVRQARRALRDLRRNRFLNLFALALAFAIIGGYLVYEIEAGTEGSLYTSYWDGVWWAIVTMTTVGYGDRFPTTAAGRMVGIVLMIGGVAAVSLMTANIASGLVSESLKEARGLEAIHWRGHVLLCGWNQHAERVVENLIRGMDAPALQLVLVNQLPEDAVNNLLFKYRDIAVRYVRGSHTDELVLERANVREATAAVVLADMNAATATDADESTVLAVLALKHLNPSLRVTGEVLDAHNAVHLRRANADEVVVSGEHNPFLLAAAVASPGLSQAARLLLGALPGAELRRIPTPPHLVGRSFGELAAQLRQREGLLTLGLITEHKGITLDEMLGSDTSFIDEFIRRKFAEAGMDKRVWDAGGVSVLLNPHDQHVVGPNDAVIVLGRSPQAPL